MDQDRQEQITDLPSTALTSAEGVKDEKVIGYIEYVDGDEPFSEELWRRANPQLREMLKHDFRKDSNGDIFEDVDSVDYHTIVYCSRCDDAFCRSCHPEKLEEPCDEQTPYLF